MDAMQDMIPAWVGDELIPREKLSVHLEGLKHRAVSVFVIARGEILIQRRALDKYHTPGLWANTCCTHPHWGEDPRDCAIRRLAEELGIEHLSPDWRDRIEYRADVGGGMVEHEVVDLFVCDLARRPTVDPNPAEVMETRWISLTELEREVAAAPDTFTPWLRIYLAEHKASVFGPA